MLDKLSKYKQLTFTLMLAVFIVFSYFYIANSFANIARQALEDSIMSRIGATNDAIAPFLGIIIDDDELVRTQLDFIEKNFENLQEAQVLQKKGARWYILYTSHSNTLFEGTQNLSDIDLLEKALQDPNKSFFKEVYEQGGKSFVSAKSINQQKNIVLLAKHSLSEVNKKIINDINKTLVILFFIVVLLILAFLRHARIIDYAYLYKQLKEIDQMKDDFISIASHELRTPLTAIKGYLELLQESLRDTNPQVTKFIQRIKISANSLSALVDDILDVSRIQQGRLKFDINPTDPSQIIKDTLQELSVSAKQKGLELISSIQEGLVINIDPQRFRQILVNLVGNAIKYTQQGLVEVRFYQEGNDAVLMVKDTGVGMTPEELSHLFEKFWRSKDKQARKQKGTGLGMWITKQLIDAMGGRIEVNSQKGSGTEFRVYFPISNYRE